MNTRKPCKQKCPRSTGPYDLIDGIELSQHYDCNKLAGHSGPHQNMYRTEWTDNDLRRVGWLR